MAKVKGSSSSTKTRATRPALTPEAEEKQNIALANKLARQQLLDGTASSQIIVHFLKQGSEKERLEREKIERENELLRAKVEALQSQEKSEEFYAEVINAMRTYSGYGGSE